MRSPVLLSLSLALVSLWACKSDPGPGIDLAAPADLAPPADVAPLHQPILFSVLGDIPYDPKDEDLLRDQLRDLDRESVFAAHIGDIKSGEAPCVEPAYKTVAGILRKSPRPMFIVPGDNEWNDCPDPDDAWRLWSLHLLHLERSFTLPFPVATQETRQENFAFVTHGVLFIGLNLVGGTIHDAAEWTRRHADNLAWTRRHLTERQAHVRAAVLLAQANPTEAHRDYFDGLVESAPAFGKPILYIHGDAHTFYCKRSFANKAIFDIQIDEGAKAPPLKVRITTDPDDPFLLDRTTSVVRARGCT